MGLFLQCMLEKLLVATGRSAFAMASQLIGALVNIALDPIFIFGLFGVPRMEAAGAAVATVGRAVDRRSCRADDEPAVQ